MTPPCGTPLETFVQGNLNPFSITLCFLSWRKAMIHSSSYVVGDISLLSYLLIFSLFFPLISVDVCGWVWVKCLLNDGLDVKEVTISTFITTRCTDVESASFHLLMLIPAQYTLTYSYSYIVFVPNIWSRFLLGNTGVYRIYSGIIIFILFYISRCAWLNSPRLVD